MMGMIENYLDFKSLIILAGAAITVASTTISGLRIHNAVLLHAPRLATLIPRDGGVVAGLLVGVISVALWLL